MLENLGKSHLSQNEKSSLSEPKESETQSRPYVPKAPYPKRLSLMIYLRC